MLSANASAASRGTRPRTSRQPSRRIPARSSSGSRSAGAISGRPSASGSRSKAGAGNAGSAGAPSIRRMPAMWRSRRTSPLGLGVGLLAVALAQARDLVEQLVGRLLAAPRLQPEHAQQTSGRARAPRPRSRPPGRRPRTTALAPIVAPAPMRTGPITLAPVPMFTPLLDRGAADVPGAQADGHERGDHDALVDLDHAVDHDLPVDEVDAGGDDDRIADRDLRERHREPVRDPRQQRHAAPLQAGLQAVERLRRGRRR